MKRFFIVLLCIISTALMLVQCNDSNQSMRNSNIMKATVTKVSGPVALYREGEPNQMIPKVDMVLLPKDVIITGSGGTIQFMIENRGVVTIKQRSRISLNTLLAPSSSGEKTSMRVEQGTVSFALRRLDRADSSFEVETPTAVAGVRGTTFAVTVDGGSAAAIPIPASELPAESTKTRVAVYNGVVAILQANDKSEAAVVEGGYEGILTSDNYDAIVIRELTKAELEEISANFSLSELRNAGLSDIADAIETYHGTTVDTAQGQAAIHQAGADDDVDESELEDSSQLNQQNRNLDDNGVFGDGSVNESLGQ